jgi:thiamine pyrophosphate-dependent acetolactate synthase large subunit-like protein
MISSSKQANTIRNRTSSLKVEGTDGQQTLAVALPWGIASCLVRPHEKTLSISGDGGFLFSAMELETAVRLKLNLVHMVWTDGTYDMVGVQERAKYKHFWRGLRLGGCR